MTENLYQNKQGFFDLWAPNYDFWLTSIFYGTVQKRLLEFVRLPAEATVLDLGCGTGRLLARLAATYPNLQGVGLDLSPQMIQQARERNRGGDRLTFRQGDVLALPFEESSFDAAFSTISFLHYPDPEGVLAEVDRVLRPGGSFYWVDYTVREGVGGGDFPFIGRLRFYSPRVRAELGKKMGLEPGNSHYLLGSVLLTILHRPNR